MKKLTAIIAAALLPLCLFAADANQMKYVEILPVQVDLDITGGWIDVSAYNGNAAFIFTLGAEANTNYAATVTVQHCSTTNGTYAAVTNLEGVVVQKVVSGANASASVDTVACDLARFSKYARVLVDQTAASNEVSVIMVAPMKSE